MNHKSYTPDEATLMAYFYNELEGAELKQVEAYLEQNPEAKAELEGMRTTQGMLGMLNDKDAGEPLVLMEEESAPIVAMTAPPPPKARLITMGFARTMIGVAAAIVLVFLMGALTNLKVKSGSTGFAISFGEDAPPVAVVKKTPPTIVNQGIDRQEVEKLLSAYMTSYGDSLSQKLGGLERKIVSQNQRLATLPQQKNVLAANGSFTVTEVQIMLDNLKKDNLKTMVELIRLSNKNQQDYVGRAIADYARYVEDQRESDLKGINRSIRKLADNTSSKQLQSDRLLAKVIERVNKSAETGQVKKR
jgi:hypothetical protein